MLTDLNESLRQLLIQKAGLDPADVEISFDPPTRDWAASSAAGRPTVNLYLFDLRENRESREMHRGSAERRAGEAARRRPSPRLDASYMVTCWTTAIEDHHRLLWRVLETLCHHSPLPTDVLQGALQRRGAPIRTEVAQFDGGAITLADYWSGLENNLRPGIQVKITLDLDLEVIEVSPLVFARVLRVGPLPLSAPAPAELVAEPGRGAPELSRVTCGGVVQRPGGEPLADAAIRLIGVDHAGRPRQWGASRRTDADGRYRFDDVPVGAYTLVVEPAGEAARQVAVDLTGPGAAGASPDARQIIEIAPTVI